ncbi:MAG: NADH-quinone oxidoreductase subunit D, partial [Deltaproteobacteria bacterium]|nr:NADH-quinone oxidoreductase subunit D [Deltaproteobacteria bacterium]
MKGMALNIGPSHPATHGAIRFLVELDGETIKTSHVEIGYLHRAFEKHSEVSSWTQVIPYTDRLNYCSAMINNVGYCRAVETLLGVEIPERAQFLRVIVSELSRIMDHLICLGAAAV